VGHVYEHTTTGLSYVRDLIVAYVGRGKATRGTIVGRVTHGLTVAGECTLNLRIFKILMMTRA
jgi:hypothetical protein